ncbi:MAG: heavy-metal-associated domain-containing protein [Candidatus Izemoplasma sp.]|nr:heavy-metal-associated domain-containing protein [Candidatus Izemoplasma sp.]
MIKLVVSNMYCGHCQLKVNAELKANGFDVISIDMAKNTVLIDTDSPNLIKIEKILDQINYVVDRDASVLNLHDYTIWDDLLANDDNYDQLLTFLDNNNINLIGFNEDDFGLLIHSTEKQYYDIRAYIHSLKT